MITLLIASCDVGAVLVGITLIYLAVQLRQNTSALKSSTFLAISTLMGSTMEVWATHSDLAPLLIKAQAGLDELLHPTTQTPQAICDLIDYEYGMTQPSPGSKRVRHVWRHHDLIDTRG